VTAFRHWWSVLLLGILSVIAGILVLVWPGSGVVALALIVGFFLMVNGFGYLSLASWEPKGTRARRWLFALGTVDIAAGLIAVIWPGITVLALALIFGIYLIGHSITQFVLAFSADPDARLHRGALLADALGAFVVGAIAIVWPDITILAVALLFGALLIYRGIMQCYAAFALREVQRGPQGPT
jgi:uncharacterized membrane protein HdeD (DUF308 family)